MENKNNTKTPYKNDTDSNPFPKLKPMGSIYINQIPKKSDIDKTSENKNSLDSEKESDFLSKLRIFDPHPNIHQDSIKHSKTFLPSLIESNDTSKEKGNIDDIKEKDKEDGDKNNNNENINSTKKKLSADINNEEKQEEKGSGYNPFNAAKKFFKSISGYVNDNFINKITSNKSENEEENLNKKEIENIFEKSPNFQEIEKYWNYQKLLLDNNILDFTSKL